ncbi:hypothetical protein [Streptomyces sp. NPDC059909]|uniref:hypothetical protein n=1 Tax=Streptomyces sp. NPDC059909 TaxID=3346998 RepID=UPI00366A1A64
MIDMELLVVLAAAFTLGLERFIEGRYGTAGLIGFSLVAFGIKAKHVGCISVGAVILAMLMFPQQ